MPGRRVYYSEVLVTDRTVETGSTMVFSGVALGVFESLFFQITNTGAVALTSFALKSSSDPWFTINHDTTTAATLAPGATVVIKVANNGASWWEAYATVGSGTTTVTVTVNAN